MSLQRTGVVITPLDPADPQAMAAWHTTYRAGQLHGREFASPFALEEVRAELQSERSTELARAWAGSVDGRVVVTGMLWAPLADNTHLATVEVTTHPDHRRQGHGSAMLEHLVAEVRGLGRRTVLVEVASPYDAGVEGRGQPNVEFVRRHGFTFALGEVMRVLDLPADEGLLDRLAARAAPYHQDYTLRRFRGPVPDDIVDTFGALVGALGTEAPMGELELEPEVFDAARIRADEQVFEASGRTKYTTVAVDPEGAVVAYTELVVARFDPERVFQWGTLVRPEHRGHRLGLATKVHNLRWLQRERPEPAVLVTWNAEVNRHMIGVNEAMGFRPVERQAEWQKHL